MIDLCVLNERSFFIIDHHRLVKSIIATSCERIHSKTSIATETFLLQSTLFLFRRERNLQQLEAQQQRRRRQNYPGGKGLEPQREVAEEAP